MTAFSYGLIDGSQTIRPSHRDDRFEMLNIDSVKRSPLPIPFKGMALGDGLAGNPPRVLEDGVFLSLGTKAGTDDSGYGPNPFRPAGAPAGSSIAHGTKFYDIAANANTVPVYMVFSSNTTSITGAENNYFVNDATGAATTVKNFAYNPGEFGSESVTGVRGIFDAWVPARLTAEVSLGGYTAGDKVTVLNGRLKKAVLGDMVVGVVEIIDTLKMRVSFDLSKSFKLQA